jgi:hypothetical protein
MKATVGLHDFIPNAFHISWNLHFTIFFKMHLIQGSTFSCTLHHSFHNAIYTRLCRLLWGLPDCVNTDFYFIWRYLIGEWGYIFMMGNYNTHHNTHTCTQTLTHTHSLCLYSCYSQLLTYAWIIFNIIFVVFMYSLSLTG